MWRRRSCRLLGPSLRLHAMPAPRSHHYTQQHRQHHRHAPRLRRRADRHVPSSHHHRHVKRHNPSRLPDRRTVREYAHRHDRRPVYEVRQIAHIAKPESGKSGGESAEAEIQLACPAADAGVGWQKERAELAAHADVPDIDGWTVGQQELTGRRQKQARGVRGTLGHNNFGAISNRRSQPSRTSQFNRLTRKPAEFLAPSGYTQSGPATSSGLVLRKSPGTSTSGGTEGARLFVFSHIAINNAFFPNEPSAAWMPIPMFLSSQDLLELH